MRFNVVVKNRFTGKVHEKHSGVSPNGLMNIQDRYLFMPWIKVTAEKIKEMRN